MTTKNTMTKFRLVVYDYVNKYPTSSTDVECNRKVHEKIVSLRYSRNKSNPNNTLSFVVEGPLPSYLFAGNWCVLREINNLLTNEHTSETDITQQGLPRFIGQIMGMQTVYAKLENNTTVQRTTIHVREWSFILKTPIEFDLMVASRIQSNNPVVSSTIVEKTLENAKIIPKDTGKDALTTMANISSKLYSPFEYCMLILMFLDALNSNNSSLDTKTILSDKFGEFANMLGQIPQVSLKCPLLPKEMLEDLDESAKPESDRPFSTGFMLALFGVIKAASKEYLNNGMFSSLNAIRKLYSIPDARPLTTNIGPEFTQGFAAWDMITQRCDPEMNEAFTDVWYFRKQYKQNEQSDSLYRMDKYCAKPVLVVRDKPYMLRRFLPELSTDWTVYDDVPRIQIDTIVIQRCAITHTIGNSPNFSILKLQQSMYSDYLNEVATTNSRVRLEPEMNRYGGKYSSISTPFIAMPKFGDTTKLNITERYYQDVAVLNYYWNCLNYRFVYGTLELKGNTIPLSVGLNIEFNIGGVTVCAQVHSIETESTVNENNGLIVTKHTVQFEYGCKVEKGGSLTFLSPREIQNLTVSIPEIDTTTNTIYGQMNEFTKKQQEYDQMTRKIKQEFKKENKLNKLYEGI